MSVRLNRNPTTGLTARVNPIKHAAGDQGHAFFENGAVSFVHPSNQFSRALSSTKIYPKSVYQLNFIYTQSSLRAFSGLQCTITEKMLGLHTASGKYI